MKKKKPTKKKNIKSSRSNNFIYIPEGNGGYGYCVFTESMNDKFYPTNANQVLDRDI